VWDCCAASGGKSIMVHDILSNISLTVSDIRESIIQNLKKRFSEAGIDNYRSIVADLTHPTTTIASSAFDLVIADVPCSGSGTWARTPEQMYFFKEGKITVYSSLQKKIVSRVIPAVKVNGFFLYITCSVFAEENEQVTDHILREYNLKLVKSELIRGYHHKADTLYAALFTNRSA
jgi:16S rRNA (cytosine967-C5)-methyltransferase